MDSLVNSEMLIIARESRGLTQKQLADMVKISQTDVSRYENGTRTPAPEQIALIAEALGYPINFFFRAGQRYGTGSSGIYHRRRKAISAKTLNTIHAKLNILREVLRELLSSVAVDADQEFLQYDPKDFKGNIEAIAEHVRAAWKLPSGPVVDLIGTIENAGGIVHRVNFGTMMMDALVQWIPPVPPIILVNENSPGDRLRFSLAHELGHIIMHPVAVDDKIESEADQFAAAFLMPARDILRDFDHVTLPKIAALKPYWKVSIAALIRRAYDLGRITERQYRSFNEEMSRLHYKIHEPMPIPAEKPTLYQEIIDTHLKELGYSVADLASITGIHEDEFRYEYLPRTKEFRVLPSVKKASSS